MGGILHKKLNSYFFVVQLFNFITKLTRSRWLLKPWRSAHKSVKIKTTQRVGMKWISVVASPAGNQIIKVNNRNICKSSEISSKLTVKISERTPASYLNLTKKLTSDW